MLKFHCSAAQGEKIRRALFEQGKIYAIKECREITGWGLRDAKDAVELYCYRLEQKEPGLFPYDFQYGNAPTNTGTAEIIISGSDIGLSSMTLRLTGNRTVEMDESDKIDIITAEANHRFSIDEIRMIVKFYDATRISNN